MLQNYNNLTILSDKIKDLHLQNLPPNLILNKNDKYTLSLSLNKFIMTYVFNKQLDSDIIVTLPIINIPYTKFTVEWDDNIISSYIYDINNDYKISYKYTAESIQKNNIKQIKIYGDFKGLKNNYSENYLYVNSLSTITISGYTTLNFEYYLKSIDSWGCVPIESLSFFCANASRINKYSKYIITKCK